MININGEFVWWMGVVEDINDPEIIGRARTRIMGYHTADKQVLPTNALPWAHPIFPITSAANKGKGQTVPGLLPGSHVFGFFLDGMDAQQPVIVGVVPGINTEENDPTVGFNSPDAYTYESQQLYEGKPDTNLLAYENFADASDPSIHPLKLKNDLKMEGVETALGEEWNEPDSPADPSWPNNKVYESLAGHVIEVDDSSASQRIHVMHNSGAYIEFQPGGQLVVKTAGPEYHITLGDNKMYVRGSLDLTAEGNVNIKAKNFTFKGEKANFELEEDFTVNCKNFGIKTDEKINLGAKGQETNLCAGDKLSIVNGGGAKIVMEGSNINLNPPTP